VRERIAELSSFVDGTGRLRSRVTGNPTRKRELSEQPAQSLLVLLNVRIEFGICTLQVSVGHESRTAVAWTRNVDDVNVVFLNQAIEMRVDEVQSWSRAPVPQQPRLDVLELQGLAQQRIVVKINLPYGKIVGRTPVRVQLAQFISCQRVLRNLPWGL
jgi:hypothetical protein